MAYDLIDKLKERRKDKLIKNLSEGVQENERKKGKKHQVFRLSFGGCLYFDEKMIEQKIYYIHRNPVSGK
jgi:hypothetical protein